MGDWRLIFVNRERLQKVTAADVQKVAATYLIPLNRTLGRYYPTTTAERVTIPGTVNIAQTANSYVPKAEVSTGEAFELTAANLLKRSERTKINGLTVTLLPKKNRGETVVAQISLSLGTTQSLGDQKLVNSYVTAMLNRGTRTLTRQQLRDKLDSLKAQVSISGSANQTTISIETLRPNLPEVLTLMGQMLKDSAFDEKEFAQIQQQSITSLEAQRTDPQRLAFDAVNLSTYQPNSLFNVGPLDTRIATVKKLNIPQLKEFYKQFYGAGLGTVTVVGDFDPTQVKKSLNEIFNNWTAPQPAQYLVPTQADLAPAPIGSEVIRVKDKENAVFVAAQTIALKEENPQYTALEAGVYIFGGSTLSSRFGDRVRQKEGLSYGAGSFLRSRPKGEFVQLINYAISNPRNSPKVEIGFSEEIKRLVTEGITADELKRTQDALIQEQSVALASDGVLADSSNGLMLRGKTFQELADREARIRALTVPQVNQALKTWIKLDQFQLVKSGDLP
jgi:zinc protease